jgi:hypothetical protein
VLRMAVVVPLRLGGQAIVRVTARRGEHHVVTDAGGIPLATALTGGNRHDVTQLMPLVDKIPPIRGTRGRPRQRPERLYADRGYDYDCYRRQLRAKGITPVIARRGTGHGSGLGTRRWVVDQTIAGHRVDLSPFGAANPTAIRAGLAQRAHQLLDGLNPPGQQCLAFPRRTRAILPSGLLRGSVRRPCGDDGGQFPAAHAHHQRERLSRWWHEARLLS